MKQEGQSVANHWNWVIGTRGSSYYFLFLYTFENFSKENIFKEGHDL